MKVRFLLILLVVCLIIGFFMIRDNQFEKQLVFGTYTIPFSSDPMDYDAYVHHHAFTSVLYGLVSSNKQGEIVPLIAKSWTTSENFSIWKFLLRDDLTFSNGDKIHSKDVLINFKRIAFLKRANNSQSGVFEFLRGNELFSKISDDHPGITLNGNEIILKFNKPMPDLLERISFGFYSIAHPSQFDSNSGVWINKRKVIASGSYEVSEWTEDSFKLKSRDELVFGGGKAYFKEVLFKVFTKEKTKEDIEKYDLIIADKASLMISDAFEFLGPENNLKIGYMKVYSWNKKNSILSKLEIRKWLRQKFYEGMEKAGFKPAESFFPLTLRDVKVVDRGELVAAPSVNSSTLITHTTLASGKIDINSSKKSIPEVFQSGFDNLVLNSGFKIVQVEDDNDLDFGIEGSGIEFDNYIDTVKFMFLSKEGIQLPDGSGKIIQELRKDSPDINFINQEIWNQAIIWPIRHYSSGFWFNKTSKIDYSSLNYNSASIDFLFLKK